MEMDVPHLVNYFTSSLKPLLNLLMNLMGNKLDEILICYDQLYPVLVFVTNLPVFQSK